MLLKFHDQRSREEGFTLIELLVVVIIIGILAAIAIPVFLAQRERAWRSASQSDLRNAAVALETYYTDTGGYDGIPPTINADGTHDTNGTGAFLSGADSFGFNPSANVAMAVAYGPGVGEDQAYCLGASHLNHDEVWLLGTAGTLSQVEADACPQVGAPTVPQSGA